MASRSRHPSASLTSKEFVSCHPVAELCGTDYFPSVKSCHTGRAGSSLIAALLFCFHFVALGQTETIRLRTGAISTPAKTLLPPRANALAAPAAGAYLVQFQGPMSRATREELRSMGAQLIQYVPDNAFIAKFNNVTADAVRRLSVVRWVGPFRPEYKIHPRLTAAMSAAPQTNRTVAVVALVSRTASASDLSQARAQFVSVEHESHLRQGTILRGELDPAFLSALTQLDSVLWVEPAPKRKLIDEAASKLVGGDDGKIATPTITEQLGFDGSGVTVCVADTGLDTGDTNTMHPDLFGRVTGFQYYGALTDGSDGYGHGTHCAGIIAGNAATGETDPDTGQFYGLGVASGASLFIERIFDENASEVSPFPSDQTLAQDAVRNGAQIGANSWGNDVQGEYDIDAAAFDELVRDADPSTPGDQPYILEFSAGNAGPDSETLDSPASGKNVIATGASENVPGTLALTYGLYADGEDTMADFSSRGPCEDGRIKPDVVAPGTWIASAASSAAPDEASIAWTAIDNYYVYMGGTSMAGPHAAGAAAVFVQFYKSTHTNSMPSPALVKAALINSANELDQSNGGPGPIPNNDEGWGRVTLTEIINTNFNAAPRSYLYLDQSALLATGESYEQHVFVQDTDQPLKITMAYTDVPGFPGAIPALVNDLDLEVIAPDGTFYRGNQFAAGDSARNPSAADRINNVEAVHLSHPMAGDYLVRVRARDVEEDARLDTTAIDQDFALVVSANLVRPGTGIILLDRTNYTAPGLMNIQVLDPAQAGVASVNVNVKSTTEPAGETYTLHSAGNYGAFTGAVATVAGVAVADGKVQIHNGDTIEADYVDSFGTMRHADAIAQLVPPILSGVSVASDSGVITIVWQTSQPADSVVRYSTNLAFNLAVTNPALVTTHSVKLTHLIPGVTYHFFVTSSDAAGNISTDNNSGLYYSFVAAPTPTVLMVDDYDSAGEENAGSTVIPDGVYTNALNAVGVSYAFWKVTERGSPQLSDLEGFPVVIWRTTDDIINYGVTDEGLPDPSATNNTLSAQQQIMIQSYLNGGGSFFMSSMGMLTQLGNVPFRRNALRVGGFKQNPDPPAPCSDCDEDFGVPSAFGAADNPITRGLSTTLDYSNYPSFNFDFGGGDILSFGPDFSDTFTPSADATAIAFESASGKPCGMSYPSIYGDSPGRVVFLSFPFDAIPTNSAVPLLRNIISFLAPGANGRGVMFLDNTVYTTNDVATVEVGDSDLAGTGETQVSVIASSRTNQVTVTLFETAHPGLFRGSFALVAGNAATNQLEVTNGDTVTLTYFDSSNNSNVTATVGIDTVPPAISQVAANTAYSSATVTWLTSKPADSSVQYGPVSRPPLKVVYLSPLVTNHSVTVDGLQAGHIYNYQVVSRDQAGNTTIDDNNGTLYTFATQVAPRPPWFDDLESGDSNWTVLADSSGSDMNWELGTPNNGLATSAYSGTNSWGSNLRGQSFSIANSYLYSPPIDLSGMSQATLTFWDDFDFTSGVEIGQLGISTNSSTPPSSIPAILTLYNESSFGWEQETVDLTPYVGQTIQIVWNYQGVQIGPPLNGWLVDDVNITGVAGGGTIVVSKNLGQGSYTLTGPVTQQIGTAPTQTFSNAPPGPYTIQFTDVAFYRTPDSQSGELTNGGTLTLTGNYTSIDVNQNGISDAWEKYYFGAAPTNQTGLADSDGDGMTDYAEFIAGTNPTNAASNLRFLSAKPQTNGIVKLQLAAVPGRMYRLDASTDFQNWSPVTDWIQATVSPVTFTTTNVSNGIQLYRAEVRP